MSERDKLHNAMDLKLCVQRLSRIAKETGRSFTVAVTSNGEVDVSSWETGNFDATYVDDIQKSYTSVEYEKLC